MGRPRSITGFPSASRAIPFSTASTSTSDRTVATEGEAVPEAHVEHAEGLPRLQRTRVQARLRVEAHAQPGEMATLMPPRRPRPIPPPGLRSPGPHSPRARSRWPGLGGRAERRHPRGGTRHDLYGDVHHGVCCYAERRCHLHVGCVQGHYRY